MQTCRITTWLSVAIGITSIAGGDAHAARRLSPGAQAAKQVMLEINRAQSAMLRVNIDRQRAFESSDEWRDALSESRRARREFEKLRSAALSELQQDNDYRAAQIEVWKMNETLASSKNQSQVMTLAHQLLERRAVLTKMETDHLKKNTDLRDARYALIDADAKVAALRRSFAESISSDPQWRAARRQLEQANARMATIPKP